MWIPPSPRSSSIKNERKHLQNAKQRDELAEQIRERKMKVAA
jgi:hypothetical protein